MKLLTPHGECTYALCHYIYLFIYAFIYLHNFYGDMYVSFYLSLPINDHNKTALFSD